MFETSLLPLFLKIHDEYVHMKHVKVESLLLPCCGFSLWLEVPCHAESWILNGLQSFCFHYHCQVQNLLISCVNIVKCVHLESEMNHVNSLYKVYDALQAWRWILCHIMAWFWTSTKDLHRNMIVALVLLIGSIVLHFILVV